MYHKKVKTAIPFWKFAVKCGERDSEPFPKLALWRSVSTDQSVEIKITSGRSRRSGETRDSEPLPDLRSGDRVRATLSPRQSKKGAIGTLCIGGERGIRTLVCFWHKLISSQPRYDHFDISPYMIKLKTSLIFVIYLAGRPVMSCCGARNFLLAMLAKFRPLPLRSLRFFCHRQRSATSPLRIPHPKIDKLACQAQGVGIFAKGEISLRDAYCAYFVFRVSVGFWSPVYRSTRILYHTFFQKAIPFIKNIYFFFFDLVALKLAWVRKPTTSSGASGRSTEIQCSLFM